jgi:hypothetical protein
MSGRRRSIPVRRRSTKPAPAAAPPGLSVGGVIKAAYEVGAVAATAALRFVTDTVRAAQSIIGDATQRHDAEKTPDTAALRKPLMKVDRRTSARRGRRAS